LPGTLVGAAVRTRKRRPGAGQQLTLNRGAQGLSLWPRAVTVPHRIERGQCVVQSTVDLQRSRTSE
jgi:hypothetical protein